MWNFGVLNSDSALMFVSALLPSQYLDISSHIS